MMRTRDWTSCSRRAATAWTGCSARAPKSWLSSAPVQSKCAGKAKRTWLRSWSVVPERQQAKSLPSAAWARFRKRAILKKRGSTKARRSRPKSDCRRRQRLRLTRLPHGPTPVLARLLPRLAPSSRSISDHSARSLTSLSLPRLQSLESRPAAQHPILALLLIRLLLLLVRQPQRQLLSRNRVLWFLVLFLLPQGGRRRSFVCPLRWLHHKLPPKDGWRRSRTLPFHPHWQAPGIGRPLESLFRQHQPQRKTACRRLDIHCQSRLSRVRPRPRWRRMQLLFPSPPGSIFRTYLRRRFGCCRRET